MTKPMSSLCVVMFCSFFSLDVADREDAPSSALELEDGAQLNETVQSEEASTAKYCIPNFLKSGNNGKLGIAPGARVKVLRQADSSMNAWTHGQTGVVLEPGLDAEIAAGALQGDTEICAFGGPIYFPDFPNGNLGQKKNKPLDREGKKFGLNLIQWTFSEVIEQPENIEESIELGYTGVLGTQLDSTFREEVLSEIFQPLKAEELVPDSIVSTPCSFCLSKPELLTEIKKFELVPDSRIREPILTAVDAMLEAVPEIPDAVLQAPLPELHVIPPGELAKPEEMILDSIVRVVAKPVTPPAKTFKDGTEVRHFCDGQSKGSKVLVMGCCWELCRKTFEVETSVKVHECINQCKSAE